MVAKLLTSMATTIPSIVIVFLLGRFYGGVHLPLWQWIVIAVIVWLGSMIFAALAVAIGYRFPPDQVQPIATLIYFVFIILGGIWFPLSGGAAEHRQGDAHLRGGQDLHRRDRQQVGARLDLVIGLVAWLADLRRARRPVGALHGGNGLISAAGGAIHARGSWMAPPAGAGWHRMG